MWRRLKHQWFLGALAAALAGGLITGLSASPAGVQLFLQTVKPSITTAIVLFLMSFSLDTSRLQQSLRNPTAAGIGFLVNMGLTPLIAWPLARWLGDPDLSLGLIIATLAPCTLATASVFTRRARGNDAVSLLVTLSTNLACVVISPWWLSLWLARSTQIDLTAVSTQLAGCVLAPTILGQILQATARGRALAEHYRRPIGISAQSIVLLLVFVAATHGGTILRDQPTRPGSGLIIAMILIGAIVHFIALVAGGLTARLARLSRDDVIAVAIAGSQKTLPIGLLIATHPEVAAVSGPFVTFPLLAFHAAQLLLDAAVADWWASGETNTSAG